MDRCKTVLKITPDNGQYLAPSPPLRHNASCSENYLEESILFKKETLEGVASVVDLHSEGKPDNVAGNVEEDLVDGLYFGDAIRFFLDAKRAGGRSERTILEYRKKLDLF